jgi:hypothetical protein
VFRKHEDKISSSRASKKLSSKEVLSLLSADLEAIGFRIEKLKHADTVSPGRDPTPAAGDSIHFDVYQPEWMCCLAIEDGHDWANIDASEGLVEPLMVTHVDTLCLALPFAQEQIDGVGRESEYERTRMLAEAVYGRTRVQLPRCLLLIGY